MKTIKISLLFLFEPLLNIFLRYILIPPFVWRLYKQEREEAKIEDTISPTRKTLVAFGDLNNGELFILNGKVLCKHGNTNAIDSRGNMELIDKLLYVERYIMVDSDYGDKNV